MGEVEISRMMRGVIHLAPNVYSLSASLTFVPLAQDFEQLRRATGWRIGKPKNRERIFEGEHRSAHCSVRSRGHRQPPRPLSPGPTIPPPPLLTEYPIPESQRGCRPDHGVPAPVRRHRVVQGVVRVGVHPIRPVPHAEVLAERQSDVRPSDGHERERHPSLNEIVPPRRVLEDLLLAEGSPERPRQDEERRPPPPIRRREEVGRMRRRTVEAVHAGGRGRGEHSPDVDGARESGGRAGNDGGGGGAFAVWDGAVVVVGPRAQECQRRRRGSMPRRPRRRERWREGIRRRGDDEQG